MNQKRKTGRINLVRCLKYFDETIGNPSKIYKITIPNPESCNVLFNNFCLACGPAYFRNILCTMDSKLIIEKIKNITKVSGNELGHFFLINDHVFYINNNDRPIRGYENWVPIIDKHCTAMFISSLRTSTQFIFKDCKIPIYPLPNMINPRLPIELFENRSHFDREKLYPVFFYGRKWVREARKHAMKKIRSNFPNSKIAFTDAEQKYLPPKEYIETMAKSKIVWCPRSVWSPPDHECNTVPGREIEAMALECMVLKHPIGIIEPEKRISGVHFVEMKNNSSDLIEKIEYYLEHDSERKEIARQGRLWYERNCSTPSRMRFMLFKSLEAMGELSPTEDVNDL